MFSLGTYFLAKPSRATSVFTTTAPWCVQMYKWRYLRLHCVATRKTQTCVNCLARVVTRAPRFSHVAQFLRSLHWLLVRYRIIFKLCTLTYQAPSSKQPGYLHSLLLPAKKARQIRSSNSDLFVPRFKTNIGSSFLFLYVAAPTIWNFTPS